MNNKKILTLLGFAAKSGKLNFGFDMTLTSIKKHKSKLVVFSSDISQKSAKEIMFFADKEGTEKIILEGIDMKTLSDAIGRRCAVVSINEKGFADACLDAFNEGGNANDQ